METPQTRPRPPLIEYPYKKLYKSKHDVLEAFKRIVNYRLKFSFTPYDILNMPELSTDQRTFNGIATLIELNPADYHSMNWISDWFNERARVKGQRYDEQASPFDHWQQHYHEIMKGTRVDSLSFERLNDAIYDKVIGCNNFRPGLTTGIIKYFDAKSMLDISAGWGDRLIGALAAGIRYVGVDPNAELFEGYKRIGELLGSNAPAPTLINAPFQSAQLPMGGNDKNASEKKNDMTTPETYDLVMTSPPYFNLEKYSGDNQSIDDFSQLDDWFTKFLMASLEKAWAVLNDGGHMVIAINNIRNRPDYVMRMVEAVNKFVKAEYIGLLPYAELRGTAYKSPQPMWIWKKSGGVNGGGEESSLQHQSEFLPSHHSEYIKYKKSKQIAVEIDKYNKHTSSEVYKVLERWFMIIANKNVTDIDADSMFISTLTEKGIQEAPKILGRIKDILQKPERINTFPKLMISVIDVDGVPVNVFKYGEFTFRLPVERVQILHRMYRGDTSPSHAIIAAALRYAYIFGKGRQWCAGIELFRRCVDAGATVEGFASPFNAQILRFGDADIKNASETDQASTSNRITTSSKYKFCSLFPDVDGPFGSLGSFFDQEHKDTYVIANPPRIIEVIDPTVSRCIELIQKHRCKFSILVPKWEDADFYKQLTKYAGTHGSSEPPAIVDLPKESYQSEDPFTCRRLRAGFDFTMFTIQSVDW